VSIYMNIFEPSNVPLFGGSETASYIGTVCAWFDPPMMV
jgi:hypothetical protein